LTAAISISRVTVVAPTSSAPRNRNGKHEDVVHLVRVIGTARAQHGIRTHFERQFRQDFRRRIGQRQNQRLVRHLLDHLLLEHTARRQAEENIRAADRFR
jgi:hypothetical protein